MKDQLIEMLIDVLRQSLFYVCESFINVMFEKIFA